MTRTSTMSAMCFMSPHAADSRPSVRVVARADGAPGLPGDAQDDERDREPDERVGDGEADGDDGGAGDDGEADVGVGAGVGAVGDEGGAVESAAGACADARGDPVADEAEGTGGGERAERFGLARVEQPDD